MLLHASVNAYVAEIQCETAFTQYQPVLCSVNDVEEKYYADGEDAYDMRKPFKQLKHKAAPVKQLKPAPEKPANASRQTSDAQTAAPADDKAPAAQTDSNPADSEKENTDKVASQEGKPNESKGKGASGKKR